METSWAAPAATPALDLRVGDFLVVVPTQARVRGVKVNSGIAAIAPDLETWRQGRFPVAALRLTFLNGTQVVIPDTFTVTSRAVVGE